MSYRPRYPLLWLYGNDHGCIVVEIEDNGAYMPSVEASARSTAVIRNMADGLYRGQSRNPSSVGEYYFETYGRYVWEFDPEYNENTAHQKSTRIGEWLGGLAFACNKQMSSSELIELGVQLGSLIGYAQERRIT